MSKDTLVINELKNLPVGKGLAFKEVVWLTKKIYYKNSHPYTKTIKNNSIPLYNKKLIAKVLNDYKTADGELNDQKMEMAYRLFIASISGNATATTYFHDFSKKYSLDGAFAEDYEDLKVMLEFWDKN
jgi:hypothetical protein